MHSIAIPEETLQKFKSILENMPEDAPPKCSLCEDRGFVLTALGAHTCTCRIPGSDKVQRPTQEWIRLHTNMQAGNWENWPPPPFAEMRQHPNFTATKAFLVLEATSKIITSQSSPRGWIFNGTNGRGKTLSSLIFLSLCAQRNLRCFATAYEDLIAAYKAGIDGRERQRIYEHEIKKADIILLDELGRESQGGRQSIAVERLDWIFRQSYRRKHLIITTNLTKAELYDRETGYINSAFRSRFKQENGYGSIYEEPPEAHDLRGTI